MSDRHREWPSAAAIGGVLLAALRTDGRAGRWTLDSFEQHWAGKFWSAAEFHQVRPLVDASFRGAGVGAIEDERELFDRSRALAAAHQMKMGLDISDLQKLFTAIDLPWAIVKGPVLAELAYPDPLLRPYLDLDVLVSPKDFGRAVAALEEHGGRLLDLNWSLQLSSRRAQATILLRYGTLLDLHWNLVNDAGARMSFRWPTAEAIASRRKIEVCGTSVATLDVVDTVLHVALHGALSGGHRLLWSKDLERLVAQGGVEWDEVIQRARLRRIMLPVGVMLRRANRLLDAHIPDQVFRALGAPRVASIPLTVAERAATSAAIGSLRHTGRVCLATARSSLGTSLSALGGELVKKSKDRRVLAGVNPLRTRDARPNARADYLAFVGNSQ